MFVINKTENDIVIGVTIIPRESTGVVSDEVWYSEYATNSSLRDLVTKGLVEAYYDGEPVYPPTPAITAIGGVIYRSINSDNVDVPPNGRLVFSNQDDNDELYEKNSSGSLKKLSSGDLNEFSSSFTSSNSTGFVWADNVLTVTHNLNKEVMISLLNSALDKAIYLPKKINSNSLKIYFPVSIVPITGTWTIKII